MSLSHFYKISLVAGFVSLLHAAYSAAQRNNCEMSSFFYKYIISYYFQIEVILESLNKNFKIYHWIS